MDLTRIEAIDPPGCDCFRCISGAHLPLDSPYSPIAFKAILNGDIQPPENNLRDGTLILYMTTQKVVQTAIDVDMVSGSDYIVLPAGAYDPPEEKDRQGINVTQIKNEHEDMQEHLINSLIAGVAYYNLSYSTFIAYRSPYGATGLIELPNSNGDAVIVIPQAEDIM